MPHQFTPPQAPLKRKSDKEINDQLFTLDQLPMNFDDNYQSEFKELNAMVYEQNTGYENDGFQLCIQPVYEVRRKKSSNQSVIPPVEQME